MAVYTKLLRDDFLNILSKYNLGELISYKEIADGVENSNYFLETSKGKYILTIFEKRITEADIPQYINLMNYYNKRGMKSPYVLQQNEGDYIINIQGKKAIIISYISPNNSCNHTNEEVHHLI